jgi:hypothetical protein
MGKTIANPSGKVNIFSQLWPDLSPSLKLGAPNFASMLFFATGSHFVDAFCLKGDSVSICRSMAGSAYLQHHM